jgi:hypothetical protein
MVVGRRAVRERAVWIGAERAVRRIGGDDGAQDGTVDVEAERSQVDDKAAPFSASVSAPLWATGASLTGVMVSVTVATFDARRAVAEAIGNESVPQ